VRRHLPRANIREHLSPCAVRGDAEMLDRAIGNLLDNAVRWSPADGHVDLTVSDGEVVVSDEGPGIADADLPFVFDRFYRSPAARGRPGSGLGLAIVRQAAELHRGVVSAANSGQGAVLRLRLPTLDMPHPVPAQVPPAPPATLADPGHLARSPISAARRSVMDRTSLDSRLLRMMISACACGKTALLDTNPLMSP
jgi:Histidine kinase-, DNA gyrase B-, and HSP90-like ATPase